MSSKRSRSPTDGRESPRSRRATIATNLVLVLVSIVIAGAMVELGCWFWVEHLRPQYLARWEFRATKPPPYQDAEYFGEAFLKEAEESVSGRLTDVAELRDFRGRYFNVVNGFRVTTDTPSNPVRRVLLFGGSTLFGQEVPDRYTIASYLQRRLNDAGVRWEVRNYGLPGMNTVQQTRILRKVALRKGDIVAFYHGVNDIYYLVFGGFSEGWVSGTPAFRPVQKLSALHKTLRIWHERLKDYSYTAKIALDVYQRGRPYTVTDPAELERNIDVAQSRFSDAVSEAAAISRAAEAEFVHFLQPQVFANASLTAYEKVLVTNPLETAPGVETAFRSGYPRLRKIAEALSRNGIRYYDVSDALDNRPGGEEVFLDFCHVSHRGNELVADRLMHDYFQALIAR